MKQSDRKGEAAITSDYKSSAGFKRCFLTGSSCHLFVSAEWSIYSAQPPPVPGFYAETDREAAAAPLASIKAAKKKESYLWDLWVQLEGKLHQGKPKHVL